MTATSPHAIRNVRVVAALTVIAASVDLSLVAAGLPAFPCPAAALGFTCPGCGLGRGVVALLRGDLRETLRLHAFAPLAVSALTLVALAAALPAQHATRLADALARADARWRIAGAVGVGLVLYWIVRMVVGAAAPIAQAAR
jgi:hypothetical protein